MKLSALVITASALTLLGAAPALADAMSPPVTMQPIPNPPAKAKHSAHKAKHHMKADDMATMKK